MNYNRPAQTALKQIRDKGRSVVLTRPGEDAVYDPATDTFIPGEDISQTVKAVFTNFSIKDIDGDIIRRDDKRVLIAAAELTKAPDTTFSITDGTTVYSVVNTETVQPGDTPILYMVQARR